MSLPCVCHFDIDTTLELVRGTARAPPPDCEENVSAMVPLMPSQSSTEAGTNSSVTSVPSGSLNDPKSLGVNVPEVIAGYDKMLPFS
jgi:hypothetical protein